MIGFRIGTSPGAHGPHIHLSLSSGAGAGTGTDVFLLVGQSNMVGRAPDNGSGSYPISVQQFGQSDLRLKAARSPLDHFDDDPGLMGLARRFCLDYTAAHPDRNIVLIPRGKGGSSFQSGYWRPGGTGYDTATADSNTLMAAHPEWHFAGVLCHQGESDAGSATYEADLDALITGLRTNITRMQPDTPVILGRIKSTSTLFDATIDGIIADTPNRHAHTAVVATEDLNLLGDNLHFDGNSLDMMGSRYFSALATAAANVAAVPEQVSGVSLTPGDGQIAASWSAPADNKSPITDYVIEISTDGSNWAMFLDGTSAATSVLITGLSNDTLYHVRVSAMNGVGTGPASAVATATPNGIPSNAEQDATAHWLFGTDNAGHQDMISAAALTEEGSGTTSTASAYLQLSSGYGYGLRSAFSESADQTLCVFVRLSGASDSALFGGNLVSGVEGTSMFSLNGETYANTITSGSPALLNDSAFSWAGGRWTFVALVQQADGGRSLYSRDTNGKGIVSDNVSPRTPGSGAIAIGGPDNSTSSVSAGFDIAEAILFSGQAKTEAELDAIYARSVARLSARGLT